jgi:hypothetical protein
MNEWKYDVPLMAGSYWWQPGPGLGPRLVNLVFDSNAQEWKWYCDGVPFNARCSGVGRWQRIEMPKAYEKWPAKSTGE